MIESDPLLALQGVNNPGPQFWPGFWVLDLASRTHQGWVLLQLILSSTPYPGGRGSSENENHSHLGKSKLEIFNFFRIWKYPCPWLRLVFVSLITKPRLHRFIFGLRGCVMTPT